MKKKHKQSQVLEVTDLTFKSMRHSVGGHFAALLWMRNGKVILDTSWGSWTHVWAHIGGKTIEEFLWELGSEYAGRKFMGLSYTEYDLGATADNIRWEISGLEDEDRTNQEEELFSSLMHNKIDFREWQEKTSFEDAYSYRMTRPSSDWTRMWATIWAPFFRPTLQEIMKKQKQAAT